MRGIYGPSRVARACETREVLTTGAGSQAARPPDVASSRLVVGQAPPTPMGGVA